jgi:hypothetical protein
MDKGLSYNMAGVDLHDHAYTNSTGTIQVVESKIGLPSIQTPPLPIPYYTTAATYQKSENPFEKL